MSRFGHCLRCLTVLLVGALDRGVAAEEASSVPDHWQRLTQDGLFKQRPAWSPDGKSLVFTRHVNESIQVIQRDLESGQETRRFEHERARMDAVLSPNGKRFAFTWVKYSPGQGDMEIYLADADGENQTPLFVTEGKLSHEEWASWSPDGEWLACTSTRDDNAELYLVKLDGTEKQRLTSDPALDVHPAFSPDGQRIAFATNRWGDLEIAVYDLTTSLITRLTESRGLDDYPAWSPTGKELAFTSRRDGNLDIFVMRADGSQPRNITQSAEPENFPSWRFDGGLTFSAQRDGAWELYLVKP